MLPTSSGSSSQCKWSICIFNTLVTSSQTFLIYLSLNILNKQIKITHSCPSSMLNHSLSIPFILMNALLALYTAPISFSSIFKHIKAYILLKISNLQKFSHIQIFLNLLKSINQTCTACAHYEAQPHFTLPATFSKVIPCSFCIYSYYIYICVTKQ